MGNEGMKAVCSSLFLKAMLTKLEGDGGQPTLTKLEGVNGGQTSAWLQLKLDSNDVA